MSAHLDLTTYFTGPDTDSGDKFTYESEIALGLTVSSLASAARFWPLSSAWLTRLVVM